MATTTYNNHSVTLARARLDWGAIWAGVFSFITIWSVFGMLGEAIFVSAANPNAPRPVTSSGMSWGMGIWAIVLTRMSISGARASPELGEDLPFLGVSVPQKNGRGHSPLSIETVSHSRASRYLLLWVRTRLVVKTILSAVPNGQVYKHDLLGRD